MANIEGAIRIDDSRIPVATSLDGALLIGLANGKTTAVPTELLKESAYLLAQQEGYTGTLTEWLESLVGNSAYEDWLAQGGAGSFEDFLDEIVETVNLLIPQTLTEAQKAQVRENIDALASSVINEELGKKADHGYTAEETPKTLKEVDDNLAQLAGDVKDTTEKAGASSLAELNARLLALEKIVSSSLRSTIEVTREFNVWGKTNLILTGSGAATFAPDFIGQKYIDTTGGNIYVAVGVATVGNWKLV